MKKLFGKTIPEHLWEFADEIMNFITIPVTIAMGDNNKYDPETGKVIVPPPETPTDRKIDTVIFILAIVFVGYMIYQDGYLQEVIQRFLRPVYTL